MDEEMIAYRERLEKQKQEKPFWEKKCLTITETAAYTGIGTIRIRNLLKMKDCNFFTTDGFQSLVIIDKFLEYINGQRKI